MYDHQLPDDYQDNDDGLYDNFIAEEELDREDNYVAPNQSEYNTNIATVSYSVTDTLTEGFGSVFPSYCEIIIKCVQLVFKIDSPTEW